MSGLPAGSVNEAERAPQDQVRQDKASPQSTPDRGPRYTRAAESSPSKRSPPTKASSSNTAPIKRPWDRPSARSLGDGEQESAEEDELSDETSQIAGTDRTFRSVSSHTRRVAPLKRSDVKETDGPSSKRSKQAEPRAELLRTSFSMGPGPMSGQTDRQSEGQAAIKGTEGRSPSPDSRRRRSSVDGNEPSATDAASQCPLSPDEVDTFLDLIFKHHPEPMTAEKMRQSVDAVYSDWAQFCAQRQKPVKLGKKALMDEYAKVFNGIYGASLQDKARSIAQELSNRAASSSTYGDASNKGVQRRASSSRRSLTASSMDEDTDEEGSEAADDPIGGDVDASDAASPERPGAKSKKNIARVGRNGLAVLPPGLFDILRNHLRDDILSSIMPSVRTDLTEQTRELFLQNQDLFGRLKEMEERVRNQELWIRHILSRDPTDGPSPQFGPLHGPPVAGAALAPGEAAAGMVAKSRSFSTAARDPPGFVRPARHVPPSSDHEFGGVPTTNDHFAGNAPMSPRQLARMDPRASHAKGVDSPYGWERRSNAASVSQVAAVVRGQAPPFVAGRREPDPSHLGGHRELASTARRPSYATEPYRRPSSWQSEPQAGRSSFSHDHGGEQADMAEAPFQPHGDFARPGFVGARRMSSFGGSGAAMRGTPASSLAPGAPGAHDDFRRPGPSKYMRDPAMSPIEPAYEIRRAQPGFTMNRSEPYFGDGGEGPKAPLPPRTGVPGSPAHPQRNKRGRPSKVELAHAGPDSGASGAPGRSAPFGANYHPSADPRSYLS